MNRSHQREPQQARDPSASEIISGVAEILAAQHPAVWRALLSTHIADEGGHCVVCRSTSTNAPVWPCTLRIIAERAERIAEKLP